MKGETAGKSGNEAAAKSDFAMPFPRVAILSGLIFAGIAVALQGMLKDGLATWTPILIDEQFHLGSSLSILITMVIPFVNISGYYMTLALNKRVTKNEGTTSAVLFFVAVVSLSVLALGGKDNLAALVLMLIIVNIAMHGINLMIISLMPMYFARFGRSSSVTGMMNSLSYLGGGISCYAIGAVSSGYGWGVTILSWIATAALGMAVCLPCAKKWNGFKRNFL